MTDLTSASVIDDAAFDPSTAAGRLRILWSATADPELAMSDDEVADVATVLAEHAAMKAELEQLRAKREPDVRAVLRAIREIAAAMNCRPAGVADALGRLNKQFASRIVELDDRDAEPEPVREGHGPGVPGAMHLEAFGQSIADAFGDCPYHVGSSATSKTWRDVDVRLILDDGRFHALFPGFENSHHIDAWWSLLCAALSELGRARTGLPVDFQIQSRTEANEKYSGIRNPLFLIHAKDEHRPAMVGPEDAA